MNRYFWLLMRFVSDDLDAAARQDVYARARVAFMDQLIAADPPFPEDTITYERLAFEEAVRSVEASIARWGHGDGAPR